MQIIKIDSLQEEFMNIQYASLQSRIKAAVIDGILLVLLMYTTTDVLSYFDNVPSSLRMVLFILFFCLYEPLSVSILGFTVGHYYNDLRVKNTNNTDKNIIFPLALIRFIIKFFLGWISLLTITSTDKKQAIHDTIASSVVIIDAD